MCAISPLFFQVFDEPLFPLLSFLHSRLAVPPFASLSFRFMLLLFCIPALFWGFVHNQVPSHLSTRATVARQDDSQKQIMGFLLKLWSVLCTCWSQIDGTGARLVQEPDEPELLKPGVGAKQEGKKRMPASSARPPYTAETETQRRVCVLRTCIAVLLYNALGAGN